MKRTDIMLDGQVIGHFWPSKYFPGQYITEHAITGMGWDGCTSEEDARQMIVEHHLLAAAEALKTYRKYFP